MKKKLLFLGLLLISFSGVKAQTVLLDEGFEDPASWTPEQEWTLYDLDGDDFVWQLTTETDQLTILGFSGNVVSTYSWDENAGPLQPDNLLVSPSFVIPAGGTAEMSYKVGAFDADFFQEYYSVYAVLTSEFEDATNLQTFLNAKTPIFGGKVTGVNALEKTFSLNDYVGQEVVLIFRHHNISDVFAMVVDDIKVVFTNSNASVNKELASKFTVFPNPVNDIVNFTNSGNILVSKVEVKDLNGRNVQSFDFNAVASSEINISQLQAGIYFLNITTNEGLLTKKIIKK